MSLLVSVILLNGQVLDRPHYLLVYPLAGLVQGGLDKVLQTLAVRYPNFCPVDNSSWFVTIYMDGIWMSRGR